MKQAAAWFQEGLSLAQEIGAVAQVGWHLVGLAGVAVAEGQPVRAARLYGGAETRIDVQVSMNDVERADYTGKVESVRGKLGEKIFTAAWAEGRSMTPEQALAAPEKAPAPVPHTPAPAAPTYPDGLTAREVEILRLLAAGQAVAEIAKQLVISPRTVTTHITTIYRKIQVSTRSAATRYAIEHKLI